MQITTGDVTADMVNIRIGIDPGLTGAVCILGKMLLPIEGANHHVAQFFDCPIIKHQKRKNEIDILGMSAILSPWRDTDAQVMIEKVSARPNQGVTSMFTFGYGAGCWAGILAAYNLHPIWIRPQDWKSEHNLINSAKDEARLKAIDKFPDLLPALKRKKDQGRADALWIALSSPARNQSSSS